MSFSPLTHALALFLLGWLGWQAGRVARGRELLGAKLALLVVMVGWLAASSWLALRGAYLAANEDRLLIVAGTAFLPIAIVALGLISRDVRALLARFADGVPLAQLTGVHVLRAAALGTLYKAWIGALPLHFIVPVGVPDFLIGLSALPLAAAVRRASVSSRVQRIWHAGGAGVLLLAVPLIQLSQPGPLHWFREGPTTDQVLAFPMAIVPTFVAPLLIGLHLAALVQLRGRRSRVPERD